MASPWHSGQRHKTHCSAQVLDNFFPWKGFLLSLILGVLSRTAISNSCWLCAWSWEQFITSKSQLSTLEPSELFPPAHIVFENVIGGEERTSTLIAVIAAPGERQRVFLTPFYSIPFHSILISFLFYFIPIPFLLSHSLQSYSIPYLFLHPLI